MKFWSGNLLKNLAQRRSPPLSPMSLAQTMACLLFRRETGCFGQSAAPFATHIALLLALVSLESFAQVPQFLVQPETQLACASNSVTFSAVAEGGLPMEFFWYRDGLPIFDGVSTSVTNSSLTLTNVQFPDSSSYFHVAVSNAVGMTFSTNVSIVFPYPLPLIDRHPTNTAVPPGGVIRFYVSGCAGSSIHYQ